MAETKPKPTTSLREPKAKSLGLTVPPPLRLPHDDLIKREIPVEAQTTMTSQTSHSSLTSLTSQTPKIAPERDFSKVPNSITREVVPAGEFKGKSKQLYDCLYSLTRGAILPKNSVRISRPRLMKKANIGSRVTFDSNVSHLKAIGLIEVKPIAGEHEGNEFIVYLPEERSMPSQSSMTSQTSQPSHAQNLDRLVSLESSQTSHTSIVDAQGVSDDPKTSFKTKERIDDEAAGRALREMEREVTGKNSANAEQWAELVEVIKAELRIAAARTTVSSVPAFLAEHLRRRLWKLDKKQAQEQGRELPDQIVSTPVDSRPDCPDCKGSGWWYPEGTEKGVAKCKHERLRG